MTFEIPRQSLPDVEDRSSLLTRLRRQKGILAASFSVVLLLVAATYFVLPRWYDATATILLSTPDQILGSDTSTAAASEQKKGDPADVESQMLVAQSLAHQVAADQNVRNRLRDECYALRNVVSVLIEKATGTPSTCYRLSMDARAVEDSLRGRVLVNGSGRARVLAITYSSPLPEVAQAIPNIYAAAYLANGRKQKLEPREEALKWLRSETGRLAAQLAALEPSIDKFRRDRGLARGQTASIASEQLSSISQRLADAAAQRAVSASKLEQLQAAGDNGQVHDVQGNPTVSDLRKRLSDVDAQIAQMSTSHGAGYPDLKAFVQQRAQLASELDAEMQRVASGMRGEASAARSGVLDLQKELDAAKEQVELGTGAETSIASLERNADILRDIYTDLSKKMNEVQTESRMLYPDAQLLNSAELPNRISFPVKLPFALTGFLLASGLGMGAALLRDRTDSTVRAGSSLQASAGVQVLGYIPSVSGGIMRRALPDARQVVQPSALQEAVRVLYANVVLAHENESARVVMLTSSQAGDGKTFLTLALAHFAAAAGRRVLAIECDLRRPKFSSSLGLKSGVGLSDSLRAGTAIEDLIRKSEAERLDIITAGSLAVDSTELLGSSRMKALLAWAREEYDLVLIDAPPVLGIADAGLLSRWVDGVLYCACWGTSEVGLVSEGIRAINKTGGNLLGVVLNKIDSGRYTLYEPAASLAYLAPVA
jgi:succinoglycan biosynthesis transport protein ExoP